VEEEGLGPVIILCGSMQLFQADRMQSTIQENILRRILYGTCDFTADITKER
jgi:hypothetical protein